MYTISEAVDPFITMDDALTSLLTYLPTAVQVLETFILAKITTNKTIILFDRGYIFSLSQVVAQKYNKHPYLLTFAVYTHPNCSERLQVSTGSSQEVSLHN